MPRSLFDQTLVTSAPSSARRRTVFVSLVLHTGALAVLVGLQFTSAFEDPEVTRPLTVFVAKPHLPMPPAAVAHRPAVAPNSQAVPTTAPGAIAPETPTTPAPVDAAAPALGAAVCGDLGATCRSGVPGGVGASAPAFTVPAVSPSPVEVLRVGGDVKPPERIHYFGPVYPSVAMTARVEGTVILEATIDEQGRVRDLRVLKSVPLLDQAAIDAVGRWRYTATRLNGVAVPVVMSVTVRFSLQ
jgi:periplasmic protein TonB